MEKRNKKCAQGKHQFQITKQKDREGVGIWKCVHCGKKVSSM
jgi:ribosomal protein L37AE/L43A